MCPKGTDLWKPYLSAKEQFISCPKDQCHFYVLSDSEVAFTVFLSSDSEYTEGSIVMYDVIDTNYGSAYDPHSASLLVPQHGLYFLSISFGSHRYTSNLAITVDGAEVCKAVGHEIMGSCSTMLEIAAGATVNVRAVRGAASILGSERETGFTGFLYKAL